MNNLAYSYIRFSTKDQQKGDSQRRQIQASKDWCSKNNYTLSEQTFFDPGKSAFAGEHIAKGELKRFLNLVENGTIKTGSILLIENFDRLSRLPVVQSLNLFLSLINAGIGIVFTLSCDKRIIDEKLINKEPHYLQMVIGECIRANAESQRKSNLSKATIQNKKDRIKSGEILEMNTVPKYFSWDDKQDKYIHNSNAKIVKDMIADYLAGNSLYSICCGLNEKNIPTFRRGFKWSATSIKCIFKNKSLIGEFQGMPYYPPIISKEDFNKVQSILANNTHFHGKTAEVPNVFRGICFCKLCGKSMSVLSQSQDYRKKKKWNTTYRYLRCCFAACEHHNSVRLDKIEDEFFGVFLAKNPKQLLSTNVAEQKLESDIAEKQTMVTKLSNEISRLVKIQAKLELDEITKSLAELSKQREHFKNELNELSIKLNDLKGSQEQFDDIKALLKIIGEDWRPFNDAILKIRETLKDNEIRKQIRVLLPSLIGKMVVDANAGTFEIFNHSGVSIYRSNDL